MSHDRDITVKVTADGPDNLLIEFTTQEVGDGAELAEHTWEFSIPKDVWKAFMTLAPGFTRTLRLHKHEGD
jgi:hypothetical protein